MLKLDRLEISGFKSFVDPVVVHFAGGITGIVGPNGCGKSNLSDAITWVLGEQSAKSLRGAKMEDIIFNGTDKRRPVGMAEVTLGLRTDPSFAHSVDGEIRLSRRVFRTGVSQYRINGKVVRLKEIKDLLMDTGLGIRAYSVIEQGKIGMILSGKPQERRKLLEEAAGITRYKARKQVAEVKLEEATGNLLRLDDIVSEVERALRSLKRQAGAAKRYQEMEREYRDLLKQVLLGRWSLLRDRLAALEESLAGRTDRDAELTAALHRDEAALAAGREDLDVLARELGERHQRQAELAAAIEGRQEFLKGARQRTAELEERLTRGRQQAEERGRQTGDVLSSLASLDQRARDLLAERDEAAQLVAEDEARIAASEKDVAQAAARLESLRQEILGSLAQVNQLRSTLQREQIEIEKRTYRQRFLDEERARLDRQLGEAANTLRTIEEKVSQADATLAAKSAQRQQLSQALESLLRREAELGDLLRALETELGGLRQRRAILLELSEEHAAKRQALVDKLAAIGIAEPRFLADAVAPVEGWAAGIDHFLGEVADAVLLEPGDDAVALARALSQAGASGVFLRPLGADVASAAPEVEDPALAYSLAEALHLPPELARALPPAFLVREPADAVRLAAEYPGVAFISRDRLWAAGGALRIQGEEAAPGVLARETELDSISDEIPRLEARLQETRDTRQRLVGERTRHASEVHRLDQEIGELQRELAVGNARRQDAAGRREKLLGEHGTVAAEQVEIAAEITSRTARKQELSDELRTADERHAGLTQSFDQGQAEVEAAKERREALRTAGAGRRGRLELLEERLESHHQEAARMQRQLTETEQQLQAWVQEAEVLQRRQRELELQMERAEEELQIALDQRAEGQEGVLEQQERLDRRRDELRGLEEQVQVTRAARDELRTEIEALRVDRAGLRQDAEHLAVGYVEEFKRALPGSLSRVDLPPEAVQEAVAAASGTDGEGAAAEADEAQTGEREVEGEEDEGETAAAADGEGEEPAAEPAEPALVEDDVAVPQLDRAQLARLEGELSRCKSALERLGPVNVLAAQEYDEQKERQEFLSTQRQDVVSSIESLKATIQEINETTSARFRETFTQVNATFGQVFAKLFRGGEAEMRLFDEEDLLETGIEIVARPPGKRLQNIMLLSGGEKALTAVALLFALFQTKPSPFCILDEVDAPLDDVNVLRFVETLKELASDTQFLVVTHNKLTMEAASRLYGVTMEEKGVSKLISVELDKVQPVLQAATA